MMHNSSLLSSPPPPPPPLSPHSSSSHPYHHLPGSVSASPTSNIAGHYNNPNSLGLQQQRQQQQSQVPVNSNSCSASSCSSVKFQTRISTECDPSTPLVSVTSPGANHQYSMQSMANLNTSSSCSHPGGSTTSTNNNNNGGGGSTSTSSGISRDIRNIRNQAEKQRRDKLNGYINELAENVPFIKQSNKRQDKTAILRLTAAYIRFMKRFNRAPNNLIDLESGSSATFSAAAAASPCGYSPGGGGGPGVSADLSSSTSSPSSSTSTATQAASATDASRSFPSNKAEFKFFKKIVSNLPESIDSFSGFSLLTNCQGKIVHVSSTIEKYLGHHYTEVLGHTLNNFLHPNDIENVRNVIGSLLKQIMNGSKDSNRVTFHCRLREKNQPRSDSISYQTVRVSGHLTSDYSHHQQQTDSSGSRIRVSRTGSPGTPSGTYPFYSSKCYSYCSSGASSSCSSSVANSPLSSASPSKLLRTYSQSGTGTGNSSNGFTDISPANLSPMSASGGEFQYPNNNSNCDNNQSEFGDSNCNQQQQQQQSTSATVCSPGGASSQTTGSGPSLSNIIFLCFVELVPTNPATELKLVDANFDEYISRHSLDGTLLYADHRISSVIGFFPNEVYGKSAYDFILSEDYSIAIFAHKLMLSNSNGTGVVVHRLHAVDGSVVFLQTAGCLQYNSSGQIDHFMCVSRMLVESEGDKERDKFVKRFTPHIYNQSPLDLYESLQLVINPYACNASVSDFMPPRLNSPSSSLVANANRQLPARFERFVREQKKVPNLSSSDQNSSVLSPTEYSNNRLSSTLTAAPLLECPGSSGPSAIQLVNAMTAQSAIKQLEAHSELLYARAHQQQQQQKQQLQQQQQQQQYNLPGTSIRQLLQSSGSDSDSYFPDCSSCNYRETGDKHAASSTSSRDISERKRSMLPISLSSSGLPIAKKSKVEPGTGQGPCWPVGTPGLSTEGSMAYHSKQQQKCKVEEVGMPSSSGVGARQPPNLDYQFTAPSNKLVPIRATTSSSPKYQIAPGQRDYTHLLGARVLTYDRAQQAKILSIYTPQAALNAKQRASDSRVRGESTNNEQKDPNNQQEVDQPNSDQYQRDNKETNPPTERSSTPISSESASAPPTLQQQHYVHHHHHVHLSESQSSSSATVQSQPQPPPPIKVFFPKQSESSNNNQSTNQMAPPSQTQPTGPTDSNLGQAGPGSDSLTRPDSSHSYYHHHHHYYFPPNPQSIPTNGSSTSAQQQQQQQSDLFVPIESLKREISDEDEEDQEDDPNVSMIGQHSEKDIESILEEEEEEDLGDEGKLNEEMEQTCDNLTVLNNCGKHGQTRLSSEGLGPDDRTLRSNRHDMPFEHSPLGMVDFTGEGDDLIDSTNEISFSFLPVISAGQKQTKSNSQFELDNNNGSGAESNNQRTKGDKQDDDGEVEEEEEEVKEEEVEEEGQVTNPNDPSSKRINPPQSPPGSLSYPNRFENLELSPMNIDQPHHHHHHHQHQPNESGAIYEQQRSSFKSSSANDPNGTTTTGRNSGNQNHNQMNKHNVNYHSDSNNNRILMDRNNRTGNWANYSSNYPTGTIDRHRHLGFNQSHHSDWLDQVDNARAICHSQNNHHKSEIEYEMLDDAELFYSSTSSLSMAPSGTVNYLQPVSNYHYSSSPGSIRRLTRSSTQDQELLLGYDDHHLEQPYLDTNYPNESIKAVALSGTSYPISRGSSSNLPYPNLGDHEDSIDLESLDIVASNHLHWHHPNDQVNLNVPCLSGPISRHHKSQSTQDQIAFTRVLDEPEKSMLTPFCGNSFTNNNKRLPELVPGHDLDPAQFSATTTTTSTNDSSPSLSSHYHSNSFYDRSIPHHHHSHPNHSQTSGPSSTLNHYHHHHQNLAPSSEANYHHQSLSSPLDLDHLVDVTTITSSSEQFSTSISSLSQAQPQPHSQQQQPQQQQSVRSKPKRGRPSDSKNGNNHF